MEFAIVIGTVVATIKDASLVGCLLLILQPITHLGENRGKPLVALDPDRNAGVGDVVVFVHSPDACMALPGDIWAPIEAAVVAIVDHVDIGKDMVIKAGEKWRLEKSLAQLQLP